MAGGPKSQDRPAAPVQDMDSPLVDCVCERPRWLSETKLRYDQRLAENLHHPADDSAGGMVVFPVPSPKGKDMTNLDESESLDVFEQALDLVAKASKLISGYEFSGKPLTKLAAARVSLQFAEKRNLKGEERRTKLEAKLAALKTKLAALDSSPLVKLEG